MISLVVASTVLMYVVMAVSALRRGGGFVVLDLVFLQALICAAGAGANWLWPWVGTVAVALLYVAYIAIVIYDLASRK